MDLTVGTQHHVVRQRQQGDSAKPGDTTFVAQTVTEIHTHTFLYGALSQYNTHYTHTVNTYPVVPMLPIKASQYASDVVLGYGLCDS